MFEVIKNLNPAQRIYAFLFAGLLSSIVAVLTVYLNTDDCSTLSDQYKTLIKNHTELMSINNSLLQENNEKQEDLLKIRKLLENLENPKPSIVTSTRVTKPIGLRPLNTNNNTVIVDGDSVRFVPSINHQLIGVKVIEKQTVITETPKQQKNVIQKILNIVKTYDKK